MKSVETINEKDFLEFYNSRTYNANCFNDAGSLNKNYNSFKTTGVIASLPNLRLLGIMVFIERNIPYILR